MELNELCIVTITWARDEAEEALLRSALPILSHLGIPVYITDGGSNENFLKFIRGLPNFVLVEAKTKGLWNQVNSSIQQAQKAGHSFMLYTEPDKKDFFAQYITSFISNAEVHGGTGVILASRNEAAMKTFPAFQQSTEHTINFCCAEVTGYPFDYTYGPFIFNSKIVPGLALIPPGMDWGWRPFIFCAAHLLGYNLEQFVNHHECPFDQRTDDAKERGYRMKQLHQSVEGVVVASQKVAKKQD